jgi:hypothetical protein
MASTCFEHFFAHHQEVLYVQQLVYFNAEIILYYIYTISQHMHCSDSLLISYSSYMFRRIYVVIREPSFMCPAELH